jgi:hypothetical protein
MNASFELVPVDGLITVTAGFTPASNVHEPESMYCRLSGRGCVSHEDE